MISKVIKINKIRTVALIYKVYKLNTNSYFSHNGLRFSGN